MSKIAGVELLTFGFDQSADVKASDVSVSLLGTSFLCKGINSKGVKFSIPIKTHLIGSYNVSNCLAAISVTKGLVGIHDSVIQSGIEQLPKIPGRMERIEMGQEFIAMVDFAHTPNALYNALRALRPMVEGRIISIFGSAGLRDKEKRRMMAEISADLSDFTILTAEDPRIEPLDEILAEMAVGTSSRSWIEGKTFWRIPDRRDAIRFGVKLTKQKDLVVAFGKGHEQSMCFGDTEYPWDDRIAMKAAIAEFLNIDGPRMPFLPTQKL
jgi:UDP-N-acetylmuramoyl-L-alanyl-D-glutamate--2,6-diaminopimelate ligase